VQAAEADAVAETDQDTDVLEAPVVTIAGQVDLSRQKDVPGCRRGDLSRPRGRLRHEVGPPVDLRASRRDVPIAPGLVDMLVTIKPMQATDDDFVFSTIGTAPIAYWNFRDRGFVPALTKGLRSAAISLYAARGLSMLEMATIMGQSDPGVTRKHYARLFDRSDVEARARAAQASLGAP
jgi:integrase